MAGSARARHRRCGQGREEDLGFGAEREIARSGGEREREPGRAAAAAELGFGVGGENDGREKGERRRHLLPRSRPT